MQLTTMTDIPDIHNPPFHPDANDLSPRYSYNNSLYEKFTAPPPSQHLIPPDATTTQIRMNLPGTNYGELVKGRPQPNVRPPFGIDISMVEICTFFPSWLQIPLVALRAICNGYKRDHIAKMQCDVVNITNYNQLKTTRDRIQNHYSFGGKLHCGTPNVTWNSEAYATSTGLQHDLTANEWKLRSKYAGGTNVGMEWGDMLLVDIANSVPRANFPSGDDRLLLTACLEYAVDHPELALDTTHWSWIIQYRLQDFEVPRSPFGALVNRDTVAHQRLFPEEYED
ncbi:hypothetical protein LTR85_007913 [Meristemomyces frigidus]|nr:hypothetical protein LTR85_007913 [Meristemomyces frigidus]